MKEQILFEKDQKVMEIDYDTLAKSADYDRGSKHPVSHFELIKQIRNMMSDHGHENTLPYIYASKSGITYPKEREVSFRNDINTIYDTRGVMINNIITEVFLNGNEESNQSLAINYNKLGIEVAFGTNISICSNMTILGANNRISNFGANSVTYEQMINMIMMWIKTANERRENDLMIMDKMKAIAVSDFYQVSREMIGHFNEMLILQGNNAPLRQGRITDIHRNLLNEYSHLGDLITVWDIFNVFTDISSHQNVIENRIVNTAAIGDYFIAKYGLDERNVTHNIPAEVLEQPMTVAEAQKEVLEPHIKEIIGTVTGDKKFPLEAITSSSPNIMMVTPSHGAEETESKKQSNYTIVQSPSAIENKKSAAERIHEKAQREAFKTEMEHHERILMRSDLSEKQKKESREFIEKFKPETSQATSEEKGTESPEEDNDVVTLF